MRVQYHSPEICPSPWVVNDPVLSTGREGLEAYYSSLWSYPALLKLTGGFLDVTGGNVSANGAPALHLVPVIGSKENLAVSSIRQGDRVFIDGLPKVGPSMDWMAFPEYRTITALKERLQTPVGEFLIPENLPLGVWAGVPAEWTGAGERDGGPFYLFSEECFLSPVNSGYVDQLIRRDKGRSGWNWRYFLAASLSRWLGGIEEEFVVQPSKQRDIRDAFSSFGFHRWVVMKTAQQLGADLDLSAVEAPVLEAADGFLSQDWDEAERLLQLGFDGLRSSLDQLTGTTRRYFAEAQHGGMLHEDIGFFEHDWPQMVCDTIREYLSHKGVFISLDMPANLFRYYRDRFPAFFEELCQWIKEGRVEILNGMFGQPFSDTHSLENLLSQFIEGLRELKSLFGVKPDIFAMEEYSLGPAMPQIIASSGILDAVHAVRLGGTSKASSPAVRNWHGIGNGVVNAIEHPDVGGMGLSTGYFLKLSDVFAQSRRLDRKILALFNLPDFGWNVLYRDEIFTALKFGPVLFELVTFRKLFDLLPRVDERVSGQWEDTFHTIFNQYTIRGNMRRYYEDLRRFEILLIAGEVNACFSGREPRALTGAWQDYLLGSSHDYTLVGGGVNGWYGASTKANYRGPLQITFHRTLESVISEKIEAWSQQLHQSLETDPSGAYLTNPHGFPVPLMVTDKGDRVLEPFSSLEVPAAEPGHGISICAGKTAVLDNGRVRCCIDAVSGAILSAQWQGATFWDENRLGVGFPQESLTMTDGKLSSITKAAEGQSVIHRGRLVNQSGETAGWVEINYSLKNGLDDLLVDVVLCPAFLPPRGNFDWQNEWDGTFRYSLPRPGRSPEIWVCQGNALIKANPGKRDPGGAEQTIPDARMHVVSPEVLGDESEEGHAVWFYNPGFPLYLVYEDRIDQFVRLPGEEHLRLRFGIGFGRNGYSPVQRSRMLLYPPFRTREAMTPLPVRWENPRIGLLRVEPECDDRDCKVWFWNYSDHDEIFVPDIESGYSLGEISSVEGNLCRDSGEIGWLVRPYSLFYIELSRLLALDDRLLEPVAASEIGFLPKH